MPFHIDLAGMAGRGSVATDFVTMQRALSTAIRSRSDTDVAAALAAGAVAYATVGDSALLPLTEAAQVGSVDICRLLLAAGAPVNGDCCGGLTALMMAAIGGHADVIRLLGPAGADPNMAKSDSWTALHLAAFHDDLSGRHVATAAELLGLGARVDARTHKGRTPRDMVRVVTAHPIHAATPLESAQCTQSRPCVRRQCRAP